MDEGIKYLLLPFVLPAHMFRMPLESQTEGVTGMDDSFHNAIFTDGANRQIFSKGIHSLVM